MPRNYKRTPNRQSWSQDSISSAIEEVMKGCMGYKRATGTFGVPQKTLDNRVKKARLQNLTPESAAEKQLGRYRTILFGVTLYEQRKLAHELAEKDGIKHYFNKETQMARKDWMHGFLKRYPKLPLRNPEKNSLARARLQSGGGGQIFRLVRVDLCRTQNPAH
ncbi:hypothetical protein PR048_006102 [Dryococelus australis]|uniref:HTH psq-type domain-containing protein n=1 Tax=Dryococelus australis TaxID=614101 RepID=A0ABQ9IA23_9NEOP|nr:hypothetical protein PR048_006102 [Dryococelus australis]